MYLKSSKVKHKSLSQVKYPQKNVRVAMALGIVPGQCVQHALVLAPLLTPIIIKVHHHQAEHHLLICLRRAAAVLLLCCFVVWYG